MQHTYLDIDAHIREANRLRSEALGEILAAGWHKFAQRVASLLHHPAHGHHGAAK